MLALMPREWKALDFSKAFPFDKDTLAIALGKNIIVILKNACNDRGQIFSIGAIMQNDEKTFGKVSVEDRIKEFAEKMHVKLLRYFVTQKDEYLFFDEIEQEYLSEIIGSHALIAEVEIYLIDDEENIRCVDISKLSQIGWRRVNRYLKQIGVVFIETVEEHASVVRKASLYDSGAREHFRETMSRNKGKSDMEKAAEDFPEFAEVKTKSELKTLYKKLSKKYHPDAGGDAETFAKLSEHYEKLKDSKILT